MVVAERFVVVVPLLDFARGSPLPTHRRFQPDSLPSYLVL
jgi:hypothetical protein